LASNADLYNRQLHPDERKWPKESAKEFPAFYEGKTGQAIRVEQAESMLLANGYRLVDAAASKGPGGM
jgi:filamentous hemagglutinin